MMTPKEAISYIENYGWSTTKLGLERTKELLRRLDNPEKKLKFVHVAGSNGKGSTCAMLSSILTAAGYKTGLYISPYIQVFNERIQINGEYIPGERLAELTERVKKIADSMEDHPSQFELVTAIAIQYYYEENCDIVVLEVGMGGALDSTNAIDAPEVAVITNIGLEHTEYLGDTLEIIAETKGGIIKEGCTCVCYDGEPEVNEVIERICTERNVPLSIVDFSRIEPLGMSLDGQAFSYKNKASEGHLEDHTISYEGKKIACDEKIYEIPLVGPHQLKNASVVLEVINVLRNKGYAIDDEAIRSGFAKTSWPARFEVLSKYPIFILDGGHNPQCAEALIDSISNLLADEMPILILGVLADKDYGTIVDMMMPYADTFVCVTPNSDRALPGDKLAEFIQSKGAAAIAASNIPKGIETALDLSIAKNRDSDNCSFDYGKDIAASFGKPIIALGSLYLAGAVRTDFMKVYKGWLRKICKSKRDSLSEKQRIEKSETICRTISEMPEYQNAKTIMLYKWTKGEVKLDYLEKLNPDKAGKTFVYPLCIDKENMIAIEPGGAAQGKDSEAIWREGPFGIKEPNREMGREVLPEEIDMVICPLVGFDEYDNRLGMGGGYYDRFLPKCKKAKKIGVAFDVQELPMVPVEDYDVMLDDIITDKDTWI